MKLKTTAQENVLSASNQRCSLILIARDALCQSKFTRFSGCAVVVDANLFISFYMLSFHIMWP